MGKKTLIKTEISALEWLLLITSKLLIGAGIGIVVVTHFYYLHPFWYVLIILGALLLIPALYGIMRAEAKEEKQLKHRMKR